MTCLYRAAALAMLFGLSGPAAASELPDFVSRLAAKSIVTISDGDFLGRSYADGQLAPESAGHRDLLTLITPGGKAAAVTSLEVSNSVTAAPEVLALSPDGRTAFVAERLKPRAPGASAVKELAPGDRLFAVDLSDPAALKITATAQITAFPESLAVSPDGRRVAVVSNTPEAAWLEIVDVRGGAFGGVQRFKLADLGVSGAASGPRGGVTATNVQWHPSGEALAVNVNTQNRVAFFRLGERPTLWGDVVEVGRDPFVGRFTPDGAHYLTANWGRDFSATSLDGRLPTGPSSISVIRLGQVDAAGEAGRHLIASTARTDASSEGLAISPDGRLVATVNMRGTAFPASSPRFDRQATVTLLQLDPVSGALTKIADFPFEGVLPEGGSFDATGEHFLATVFQGHDGAGKQHGAGLEVFRVERDGRPSLARLGRIPLPHGVHHVAVHR
jgi:DNA-binding beta-propeller fold protein YncE